MLIVDNFDNQEALRNEHGLEILLENCIIDEYNPFIKERVIICLKVSLKDNQKNQNFIRKIEKIAN
ncbi:Ctr86p ASCRUDRAFT_77877 [Ascoidea rubescens DSM 1968]|uniref:Ataxin-10 homolog n=1 Tax=Ascoidea rubescens DSM 1968 TaxID=1344418 RepID=A0A1D2V9S0_9ASCO|nr:hypothetical protein ASCRUDRAFT_77877 [Ascoidea rubescens DSM 1968]ODV58390.1 hypothetical protein ASCRUDRAFT_77877 [Ascoidea rubescens DSM 1968]